MGRPVWLIIAAILGLAGYDLVAHQVFAWAGYLLAGVGIGIGCAVLGSFAHDALAGSRERL